MSTMSVAFIIITLLLTLVLPIVACVVFVRKNRQNKGIVKSVLFGALGFYVTQMVIRLPLLSLPIVSNFFASLGLIGYFAILALTAGLFETTGRFIVFKFFIKPHDFKNGFAAGLGHGSIESITLVGINYLLFSFISIALAINPALFDISTTPNLGFFNSIIPVLADTNSLDFLLAGFERVFTMIFHIALSLVLLLFMIKQKNAFGFVVVTLIHATVDFVIPLVAYYTNNILLAEALIAFIAICSFLLILKIKPKYSLFLKQPDIEAANQQSESV